MLELPLKAYEVMYTLTGSSGNRAVVIVKEEEEVGEALARKDARFKFVVGEPSRWYKIASQKEIPLTNVRMADLTFFELMLMMGRVR
jgi:hypothetical protein